MLLTEAAQPFHATSKDRLCAMETHVEKIPRILPAQESRGRRLSVRSLMWSAALQDLLKAFFVELLGFR